MAKKEERYIPVRDYENPEIVRLIPVSEEVYKAIDRETGRLRKALQRADRCYCPTDKLGYCDFDCHFCNYYNSSHDTLFSTPIPETEGLSFEEVVSDENMPIFSYSEKNDLIDALHTELKALDPCQKEICDFIMRGMSERAMSEILGVSQTTLNYRKQKILKNLRKKLQIYYK